MNIPKGGSAAVLALAAAWGLAAASPSGNQDDLVAQARSGNRESLAAVAAMSARVTLKMESDKGVAVDRGVYLRSPNAMRVTEKNERGEVIKDIVYRAGTQKALLYAHERTTNRRGVGAVIAKEEQRITELDAWNLALCYMPNERRTLDETLRGEHTFHRATTGSEGGKRWVQLEFDADDRKYTVRLDPAANYLIDRLTYRAVRKDGDHNTDVRSEYAVTSFREVAPGVYFPAAVVSKHYDGGKLFVTHTAEFLDVKVNPIFPAGAFDLKFPTGVYVTDRLRGTRYRIDANEQPAGEVYKYAPVVSYGNQSPTPVDADEKRPWSWPKIFLLGSAAVLAVGIGLVVRARMKGRHVAE